MADSPQKKGRSHPPSLLTLAERTIRDHGLFAKDEAVLCACSGGPDSTALLHALALLRKRLHHKLFALGVDHGLRPAASDELALAARLAADLSVPFETVRVRVEPGSNLQARARTARFEAFFEFARKIGAARIATGHTADDRAETFLIRLLAGAGPAGLTVLPPMAVLPHPRGEGEALAFIRPLIQARRSDVLLHLERHALAFARDPSNEDPRFTRVRVRKELLPLMENLSPRIVLHLCALSEMLAGLQEGREDMGNLPLPEEGGPRLGRAQRLSLERAQRLGRASHELWTEGGEVWRATFPEGKTVLTKHKAKAGKAKIVK